MGGQHEHPVALIHRALDVMMREADRSDPLVESLVALTEAIEQLAHVALVSDGLSAENRVKALRDAIDCARAATVAARFGMTAGADHHSP
ncbi:hypothetical protein ACIA3K_07830 [Micromonospora sp. NPDC051543]|uniref:hypothetical protein n=1 Tax=Micromonospora sp. NPDC051543 TaxID=3364287 RepID=UPI0037ABAA8D